MKKLACFIALFCLTCITSAPAKENPDHEMVDNSVVIDRIGNDDILVSIPYPVFSFNDVKVTLKFRNPNHTRLLVNHNVIDFIVNGEDKELTFVNGEASFTHRFDKSNRLSIYTEDFSYSNTVTAYPLWAIFVPVALTIGWIVIKKAGRKKADERVTEEKKAA